MTVASKLLKSVCVSATLGLLSLSTAAQAQSQLASPVRFVHDKSGYEVVARMKNNGIMVLNGTHSDGRAFQVIVGRDGKVTGSHNKAPVDFKLKGNAVASF
jgi:hypothetical protein